MKRPSSVLLSLFLFIGCQSASQETTDISYSVLESVYADPQRFEASIEAFEAQDLLSPPPEGAVVCVGSSSMRGWHATIAEDLTPLTVIPRGFGGSTMFDALYYTERIVTKYKPRAVLVYEGDNDIASDVSPETILEAFHAFLASVHAALPETRIYLLAIKPSIARWQLWPQMQAANALLKATCEANPLLTYIDIASPMLDESGEPKPDIFLEDDLHMNERGYALWTTAVRPILVEHEARFENR